MVFWVYFGLSFGLVGFIVDLFNLKLWLSSTASKLTEKLVCVGQA